MATHDYVIANQSGAAFRTDLNNALAAIVSNNSNSSSPSTTYAYQWWADTSNGILKLRNSSNNAWIDMLNLDGTNDFKTTGATVATFQRTGSTSNVAMEFKNNTSSMFIGLTASATGFAVDDDNALGTAPMFFVQKSDGNVGIGQASPASLLTLNHATNPAIQFQDSGTKVMSINAEGSFANIASFEGKALQFATNSGSGFSSAMVIDTSQRVGIGTSSPSNMLHLSGTDPIIQFTDTAGGDSFGLFASHTNYLGFYNFTDSRVDMAIDGSGKVGIGTTSPDQELTVAGSDPVISVQEASVSSQVDIGTGTATGFINIQKADGTRTVQLSGSTDSYFTGGDVGIGISSPASLLHVSSSSTSYFRFQDLASETIGVLIRKNTTSTYTAIDLRNANGPSGTLTVSNGSVSLSNASDYRLKENETVISDGITKIKQLIPRRFNFKVEPSKTLDGFFAHEVSGVVEEAVIGEKDATIDEDGNGYQQLDATKLIPILTAGLKEAISKIETLETKVAALEAA